MDKSVFSTITPDRVRDARARIAPYVRHTPLEPSHELSRLVGANVFLKLESQQVTGSFKPRVSFSKLLALDEAQRARGVIASTAGGHGIGLSYAARALWGWEPTSTSPARPIRGRSRRSVATALA